MKGTLDLTNMSSLNFNEKIADKVEDISSPLFQYFGITHFGHIRIFKDGTMLRLATNRQNWTRTFFERACYNDIDLYAMRDVPENESRVALLTGEPQTDHCLFLCKEYNIWNALVIYEKFNEHSDFWFFAGTPNDTEIIKNYINKIDILKKFTRYFKEKFSHDLKNIDPKQLIVSQVRVINNTPSEKEKIKTFINSLNVKYYRLEEQFLVSRKEFECLFYLAQGKTMKETARFMNVSFRTIEFHLNNLKRKTNFHKKSQLIDFFLNHTMFCSILPSHC